MAGAIAASSVVAAPAAPPVAKYVDKIKVIDSKNKTVGFISSMDGDMSFKTGNRYFSVGTETDGFHSGMIAFYEASDCSGAPSFAKRPAHELPREFVTIIKKNDGYDVYLPDLNSPDIEPSATTINSYKNDLPTRFLNMDPSANNCAILDWSDPNNYLSSAYPGQKLRPGKLVGRLPFIPPFSLK
jgi:hypothetical protein